MSETRNVAILVFDEVEVLDFCGPFEVFAVAGREGAFNTYTLGAEDRSIRTRGGMEVVPEYTWADAPVADILVVPGGYGTRPLTQNAVWLEWVQDTYEQVELVLSVCTGSLILGAAGLLDGMEVTTHHRSLDELARVAPGCSVQPKRRYIDNGKIVTAAGISAGIDAALYVVSRLYGLPFAREVADYMEYEGQFIID